MSRLIFTGVCTLVLFAFTANTNADVVTLQDDQYGTKLTFTYNEVEFVFRSIPGNGTLEAYWMAETETTQAQWSAVYGSPSTNNRAVGGAGYGGGESYANALNAAFEAAGVQGLAAAMPTASLWKYAALATIDPNSADIDTYMDSIAKWRPGNFGDAPAKTLEANPWGLYDTWGNLWEVVAGDDGGTQIIGGCMENWGSPSQLLTALQNHHGTDGAIGFRVMLTGTYEAPSGGDGDGGNVAPEPATLALFGLGIAGLAVARRRKK